jgi:hypothetical protein
MTLARNRAFKPRTRAPLLAGAAIAAFLILGPTSAPGGNAGAGSSAAQGGPLELYAGPGEDNHVTVGLDGAGGQYRITDTAGIPSVSPDCTRLSASAASCPASLVTSIEVNLADGSDSFQVVGAGVGVPLHVSP